jgi:hypothetical protein
MESIIIYILANLLNMFVNGCNGILENVIDVLRMLDVIFTIFFAGWWVAIIAVILTKNFK